ncbi:DUF4880 domain-containing protein [Xylophilus rhododendri]|uniref:DUF4880 domain-containing protein n=1 Tax=Xylophilus rhododendri TaxID=2697032 RepID=A0A857J133_9BURK|nr:FecR domain-containing protein [Xylophilus rhododendri]QHI97406.1 DUF4880 domain-containing protein [Xylophilus rhododendri]
MHKPTEAPLPQAVRREAQAWVVRLSSGQATEDDARAFRAWCALGPAHASAFAQSRAVWAEMQGAARRVAGAEARAAARPARGFSPGRRLVLGGAVAASAGYLALRPPLALWPSMLELAADYRTGPGEQRELQLAQGTVLRMNTRTRLDVQDSAARLRLIEGEIEMDIRRGAALAPVLRVNSASLAAKDARYNVRLIDGMACVSCLAGEVELSRGTDRVTLAAGRQLTFGAAPFGPATAADEGAVSAWRKRLLVFDGVALEDVVAEINRYRPGKLILTSRGLGRRQVQASFSIDRLDDAIVLMRDAYGVAVTRLPGGIVLLGEAGT